MKHFRLTFLDDDNEKVTLYFETYEKAYEWIKPRRSYGNATLVEIIEVSK